MNCDSNQEVVPERPLQGTKYHRYSFVFGSYDAGAQNDPETQKTFKKLVILQLSKNNFDARTFLKHRRVPLRIFLLLWDKNFSTENRDKPPLRLKFFDTRY